MHQITQQPRAAALHYFFYGAAQVDVHLIETQIFGERSGGSHHWRIGTENLRGDGMLVGVKVQIMQRARGIAGQAFGAGEFRHDQAARTERPNHAAKYCVGNAGHRRQDRRRTDHVVANFQFRGNHDFNRSMLLCCKQAEKQTKRAGKTRRYEPESLRRFAATNTAASSLSAPNAAAAARTRGAAPFSCASSASFEPPKKFWITC